MRRPSIDQLRDRWNQGLAADPWWFLLMSACLALNVVVAVHPPRGSGAWGLVGAGWFAAGLVVVALPFVLPGAPPAAEKPAEEPAEEPPVPLRRDLAVRWTAPWLTAAAGVVAYCQHAGGVDMMGAELGAGSAKVWPGADPVVLAEALAWDFLLIACYGTALWLALGSVSWVWRSPRTVRALAVGRALVTLTVLADVAENLLLLGALRHPVEASTAAGASAGAPAGALGFVVASLATAKFAAAVPAVVLAVVAQGVLLGRLVASAPWRTHDDSAHWKWKKHVPVPRTPLPGDDQEPGGPRYRWERAYQVPPSLDTRPDKRPASWVDQGAGEDGEPAGPVGFCLSGGGIRSASVSLGFLQAVRHTFCRSRYVVSVSGGGYTSGALALLLTDGTDVRVPRPDGARVPEARTAYLPGTLEYDRLRRHASYISSTASEMWVALGVVARGLLASLAVLLAPAVLLGVLLTELDVRLPGGTMPRLQVRESVIDGAVRVETVVTAWPALPRQAAAVGIVAVVAALLWFVQLASHNWNGKGAFALYTWARASARSLTACSVVVGALALGLPGLAWAAGQVGAVVGGWPAVIGGSAGAVLLSYVTNLAALLWRQRTTLAKGVTSLSSNAAAAKKTSVVSNGLVQLLLVMVTLLVLCTFWLLLLGASALATATERYGTDVVARLPGPVTWSSSLTIACVAGGVVVVLGVLFDEVSLGLHPFYRNRLATAFATRLAGPDGSVEAVRYDDRESTRLSAYGRVAPEAGRYPEVVFAAAANLTGEHRAPAGLNAVSFTMSADWCGGPDVGWVETRVLERLCPRRLGRDLTVQGAVAISGAAVASAMGRASSWYQTLLAVTGARLGTWLPNPAFVLALRDARHPDGRVRDWTFPALPGRRRLTYLLREVFNVHSTSDRLLHVTDGGHYENLGIVELLRRRCTTVFCVDGGGDSPPTAQGLAEAIRLAKAELGVDITLDDPWRCEPGSGDPLEPEQALAHLNGCLVDDPVITGRITYPPESGLPKESRQGKLYVAKASLWKELPYELLSYAAAHPEFPHNSTSDQWFDDEQLGAYTALGRALGQRLAAVAHLPQQARLPQQAHPTAVDRPAGSR